MMSAIAIDLAQGIKIKLLNLIFDDQISYIIQKKIVIHMNNRLKFEIVITKFYNFSLL